jgi:GtrA-like protein.
LNYLTFLLAFAVLGIHDILANLIGIAVAAILNYIINSNWTWRKEHGSN